MRFGTRVQRLIGVAFSHPFDIEVKNGQRCLPFQNQHSIIPSAEQKFAPRKTSIALNKF
jgi:hypothetical protein